MNTNKRDNWLKYNGFNEYRDTYIIGGETYSIKEKLKQDGFLYHPLLGWHKASFDIKYSDRIVKVNADEILTITAWGDPFFFSNAKNIIQNKIAAIALNDTSNWVGEVNKRIVIEVHLVSKSIFYSKFGIQNIYTFEDKNNNIFVWFTTTKINIPEQDYFTIAGTVKEHTIYKNMKQTLLKRVVKIDK